ncbi:MAG: leucine-rich repeat domain-containing protein [Candidatus Thorarchaeota archaeon]
MSDKPFLTVRSAREPLIDYHFIFKTPADEGSNFHQRKSNLEWVEEIDKAVRIDISSNWLTEVDLSPLTSCKGLEYLSLAVNRLQTIDLTPLQNCKRLRHLDLSHNNLTEIDLTPLAECESLVYLYMQENRFSRVNIAPLLKLKYLTTAVIQLTHRGPRPKIIIDSFMSNKPPHLNDVLFAFIAGRKANFVPEWLYDKSAEVEYSPQSYAELVAKFGWRVVKEHLLALSKTLKIENEFSSQNLLLKEFGFPELACYDGKLRDIVKLLPTKGTYETGVHLLKSRIVSLLEKQLETGGSTLYFDMEILATTCGSVLIPSLLKRRESEMRDVTLFDRKGTVDLLPLWATSYGHKILRALAVGRRINSSRLPAIEKALNEVNHDLQVEKVVYDARKHNNESSLRSVILSHLNKSLK